MRANAVEGGLRHGPNNSHNARLECPQSQIRNTLANESFGHLREGERNSFYHEERHSLPVDNLLSVPVLLWNHTPYGARCIVSLPLVFVAVNVTFADPLHFQ